MLQRKEWEMDKMFLLDQRSERIWFTSGNDKVIAQTIQQIGRGSNGNAGGSRVPRRLQSQPLWQVVATARPNLPTPIRT